MVRRCRDFGRDLARGPVEVGPTAHFMMGGVVVDPDCRTATEGLFAAGEDTGGVHGPTPRRQRRRGSRPCSAASPAT